MNQAASQYMNSGYGVQFPYGMQPGQPISPQMGVPMAPQAAQPMGFAQAQPIPQDNSQQEITNLKNEIEQLKKEIEELKEQLKQKDEEISEKDDNIEELKYQIEALMPLEADEDDKTFTTISAQVSIKPIPQPITKGPNKQIEIKPLNPQNQILPMNQQNIVQQQNQPIPKVLPDLPEQELGIDEENFTLENLQKNFGEWAGKMFISSAEIQTPEIKQIYTPKAKSKKLDDLDIEKILNQHPSAVILFQVDDNVFAIKGSKKYSDAKNTGGLLEDPEFEIYVLMRKGEYQKGLKLKPKDDNGFDFSDKTDRNCLFIVYNLFTITKTKKMLPTKDFFDEEEMENLFEITGDCIPLIEAQKGKKKEFTIDQLDIITYKHDE